MIVLAEQEIEVVIARWWRALHTQIASLVLILVLIENLLIALNREDIYPD